MPLLRSSLARYSSRHQCQHWPATRTIRRKGFPSKRSLTNKPTTTSSSSSSSPKPSAKDEQEALDFLAERSRLALGKNNALSLQERRLILKDAGFYETGRLSPEVWTQLVQRKTLQEQEQWTLRDFVQKSHADESVWGQRLLTWTAKSGMAFFALSASHIAGSEAGFHIFGATLVGCVTALGGGTINGVVTGATPVGWIKDPSILIMTVVASWIGFYIWPLVEDIWQDHKDSNNSNNSNMVVEDEKDGTDTDKKNEKTVSSSKNKDDNLLRYALESIGLSALAVVGAQQGIVRGLHPFVSASLGVTVTIGGVMRDVLCGRDLTLGAATGCQSYGIASFAGASVYVALRQFHVWNCAGSYSKLVNGGIPLTLRLFLGFSTALAVRAVAWQYKPDNFLSTMDESVAKNKARIAAITGRDVAPSGGRQ